MTNPLPPVLPLFIDANTNPHGYTFAMVYTADPSMIEWGSLSASEDLEGLATRHARMMDDDIVSWLVVYDGDDGRPILAIHEDGLP